MTALPAPDALRAAVGKPRRLSYRLHSLFGLQLSLFLAFVCATGTLATISHELEWLFMPQVRASAAPAAPRWGAMWDAARAHRPDGWVRSVGTFDRSDASYFAKAADVALPDGRSTTVLLDPGSAQVTGELHGVTFHSFMRGLHYYLFTPGDWGFYAVTVLSFVLLGSVVTGLLVYRRFWKGLFRRPRLDRDSRTWLGDLHRLGAIWSLPFVLIIAVTGIWYFAERIGPSWETPPPTAAALRRQPDGATVERWVATARRAMPGLAITAVSLPYGDGDPVTVQGEWRAWLVRERTNAAYIDPVSGRLLGLRVAHELGAVERWVHMADPLHFGSFAGVAGKLLWFSLGLILTGLAMSGAVIHGKRVAAPLPRPWPQAWRDGLGATFLPTLLLIVAVPGWFFYNGWESPHGQSMALAGRAISSGRTFQLWRDATEAGSRWCAWTPGPPPSQLGFRSPSGERIEGVFDGGRFCAETAAKVTQLILE